MNGRHSMVLVAFLAGLLGGTAPRVFLTERVAFAQNPQDTLQKYKEIPTPATNVIRAERIELVNNRGKALAVFDVTYSEALPAGSARLTFTSRDEVSRRDRKAILMDTQLALYDGQDDWARIVRAGGLTFHGGAGSGAIGIIPISLQALTLGPGVVVAEPTGITTLSGRRIYFGDRDGRPVLVLPQ
jgi:hypothetical protein